MTAIRQSDPEDLLDVPAVLLAAVRDEDLGGLERDAARAVVVLEDRLQQEVVALVGRVAAEALRRPHLVDGLAQRLDHRRHQRQRHVADPEPDDLRAGFLLLERAHAAADLGEQVAGLELAVALVDARHGAAKDSSARLRRRSAQSKSTPGFSTPAGSSSRLAARSARAKASGRSRSYQGRWSRPTAW